MGSGIDGAEALASVAFGFGGANAGAPAAAIAFAAMSKVKNEYQSVEARAPVLPLTICKDPFAKMATVRKGTNTVRAI